MKSCPKTLTRKLTNICSAHTGLTVHNPNLIWKCFFFLTFLNFCLNGCVYKGKSPNGLGKENRLFFFTHKLWVFHAFFQIILYSALQSVLRAIMCKSFSHTTQISPQEKCFSLFLSSVTLWNAVITSLSNSVFIVSANK